jgi:hypothetical protein
VRTATLLLALALAVGCSSGRDYRSANRSSLEFLREGRREGKAMRKKNLHEALQFGERAAANKRVRKQSRAFAAETFFKGQWDAGGQAWRALRDEMRFSNKDIARNARFGFLDSGE